jgi:hypothetical protein
MLRHRLASTFVCGPVGGISFERIAGDAQNHLPDPKVHFDPHTLLVEA